MSRKVMQKVNRKVGKLKARQRRRNRKVKKNKRP